MLTRRQLLARGAAGAGALTLPWPAIEAALAAQTPPPFQTPLPIPVKATPIAPNEYRIAARPGAQRLHARRGQPLTQIWGYDDGTHGPLFPGPTIEVQRGTPTTIHWVNDLPATHLFPIDPELTGGDLRVRTLTHVHGGHVAGASDGNPYATPQAFLPGDTYTATYPNDQAASTIWYHDHALGITRLNVYAGLAGYFIVRDALDTGAEPNPIGLPGGRYEIPLAIQDRTLDRAGQLAYPAPPWSPEFFGDVVLVNGAVWPFLDVEPRTYRFRLLNGSNARFYHLDLAGGPAFNVIGTDGGLLDAPVRVSRLLLAPGERLDVVVDFAGFQGATLNLRNVQLPGGTVSPAPRLSNVMQLRVGTRVTAPTRPLPAALPGTLPAAVLPAAPDRARDVTLEEQLDAQGEPVRLVLNGRRFEDPVTEEVPENAVEDWRFINLSADTHPMHLHLVQFQVLDRRPFDVGAYQAALDAARAHGDPNPDPAPYYTGPAVPAPPEERGFKDTVRANPGEVTRIRASFELFGSLAPPQSYVYHCHILEHEDNDMMRPYRVV